jgi:hypothetical protein
MKFLFKFFDNNGHLRGLLYFTLAALPIIGTGLEHWSKTPPANLYEISTVLVSALIAGLVSLRAYLDQHLARNPAPIEEIKAINDTAKVDAAQSVADTATAKPATKLTTSI